MPKIVKNGLEYSGTPLEEVTAWPPTGDSVQIEQPLMGSTDISEVGDGTVTGAIAALNDDLTIKRVGVELSQNYATPVTNLKNGVVGIMYGLYSGNYYSMVFDVASIESAHQMFISNSAYCDFTGSLTNNTITVTNVHGFSRIVAIVYVFGI